MTTNAAKFFACSISALAFVGLAAVIPAQATSQTSDSQASISTTKMAAAAGARTRIIWAC